MANTSKKSTTTKTKTTKAKNAKTTKKSSAKSSTRVTRIKASESSAPRVSIDIPEAKITEDQTTKPVSVAKLSADDSTARRSPQRAIGDYFVGAWRELRQVRWPNRSQTWQMTGALIGFTAFFVIVILLLDAAFKYLFNVMLGH